MLRGNLMLNFIRKILDKKKKSEQGNSIDNVAAKPNPQVKSVSVICPYCKKELPQRPQRKKKCPFCMNPIFVKRRPNSELKELFTEREAQQIDAEWDIIYRKNDLIRRLEEYGFTENDFNNKKNEKIKQTGSFSSDGDVIWALFNEKLQNAIKENDFAKLHCIYYGMSMFLVKEGRNPFETLKLSQKMKLLDYQQQGLKKVEISWSDNGCEFCKKLNGKKYYIKKALEEMPLPNKDCSMDVFEKGFPWCRCIYLPVIE